MNEQSMAGWWVDLLAEGKSRIEALAVDLAQAPAELVQLVDSTRGALMTGTGVRGATYLAILLFVGIAVEWLYWTYAYASLRAVQTAPAATPTLALHLGWRRLVLLGSGLFLFTAATIGVSAAFAWPAGVQELVVAATFLVFVLRASWIVLNTVLAPRRPALQLVPLPPERVRSLNALLMAGMALVALGQFLPLFLETGTPARHLAGAARFLAYTAAALVFGGIAFAYFGRRASGGRAAQPGPLFPKSFVLALLVALVYGTWLMHPSAAAVAVVAAVVIGLQLALRPMVYFYWSAEGDAAAAKGALPAIVLSLARFVVALAGIGAAAVALDTPLSAFAESVSPWARIGLRLLGVAVLALLAHGVWIAIRSVVDHRLSEIGPVDPHHPPDASSRLLTLLPILRVTAGVLLAALLALSALWALGIEITPLLAGAGVLGIALGFGAQALVRDVIAGIFYLAEDAFRVGEYIEGGNNTKGTVERITLRSVALRHHNGPLHFVPYGSLGTVRNTSRDWVIDKFNLPLPLEADSEKVRKMFKKIGEEMKADPALGEFLMEPLKGKLYRVDPGVKIFRCKFRCPPGKQFDIRVAAMKRIESGLKAMGVGFADGRQTVLLHAPAAADA